MHHYWNQIHALSVWQVDHIAELVFWCTVGCMTAQTSYELDHAPPQLVIMWDNTLQFAAPTAKNMKRFPNQQPMRPGGNQGQYQPPQQMSIANPTSMGAPQEMMVTVPQGVIPGQTLLINHPTNGMQMQVLVPPNVQPGQQFAVRV